MGEISTITPRKYMLDPSLEDTYPPSDYSFPNFPYDPRRTPRSADYTRAWKMGLFAPLQSGWTANSDQSAGVEVSTVAGIFVPSESVPGVEVKYDPANKMHIISFPIADGSAGQRICFRALSKQQQLEVGRFGSVPTGDVGSLQELITRGGHKRWIDEFPLMQRALYAGRRARIVGTRVYIQTKS